MPHATQQLWRPASMRWLQIWTPTPWLTLQTGWLPHNPFRLAGSQSSGAMVDYIHHIASLASANWSIVGRNGSSASSDLADVNGETVLLSISVSPYLRRTLQITETAAAVGATVVAITDDVRSPILRFSHHSFIVPTDSLQFFPSHVSILTLLEILGGMVVRRLGHQANSRIDRVEQLSRAVGDYVE